MVGDGEEQILELCEHYDAWKARGGTREEFLLEMANIEGNYVPRFYEAQYDEAGEFAGLVRTRDDVPARIRKRCICHLINCSEVFVRADSSNLLDCHRNVHFLLHKLNPVYKRTNAHYLVVVAQSQDMCYRCISFYCRKICFLASASLVDIRIKLNNMR